MQACRAIALFAIVLYVSAAEAPVLRDLDGRPARALTDGISVFLFVRTDCPISNRYAPEIARLQRRFAPQGVRFSLVYVDPKQPAEAIRSHLADYGYRMEALSDREHEFVRFTGVRVTPEAAVFTGKQLLYRGRVDDRYAALGRVRPAPTVRDLEQVLSDAVAGKGSGFRTSPAVGCFIEDLR